MKLKRNLAASLLSSVISASIGIAVVPIYLRLLGVEAYGLIGLLGTVQALFSLLDFGLAPAASREVARAKTPETLMAAQELLHTLALIYWVMALVIVATTFLAAPLVAQHWIHSSHLATSTIESSVLLMGLVVACRWPIALYLGVVIGAERLVLSSVITLVTSCLSGLGSIVVLILFKPRIETVFAWQALVGMASALAMRHAAWRTIGAAKVQKFSLPALKRIWRFSAGLSGVALSALLLTQVDKLVLSQALTLEAFGQYSVATVVASSLYLFITPTFNIAYPRFTSLVAAGDTIALGNAFRFGTRVFITVLSTVSMLLAVFAHDLVRIWTGNDQLASNIALVIGLLAIGVTLHGAMFFPYALQLAYANTRLPLTINLILILVAVPLMAFLAWNFQLVGGAIAWVLLFTLYLFLGTWLSRSEFSSLVNGRWLALDVLVPISLALIAGVIGVDVSNKITSTGSKFMLGAALGLGNLAIGVFLWPQLVLPHLRQRLQRNRS